jgi:hypothetical protein
VLDESACNRLARRLLFSVCAEMVLIGQTMSKALRYAVFWASVGLSFFDNSIFDGRDTLAAPPCFLHVIVGNSLGTLSDRGWSSL